MVLSKTKTKTKTAAQVVYRCLQCEAAVTSDTEAGADQAVRIHEAMGLGHSMARVEA